jgi:hypothetical protein
MDLTKQSFDNLENKKFDIYFQPEEKHICELIEVKGLGGHSNDSGQKESFSLVFQSSHHVIFEQNAVKVCHPELHENLLFLVPIGADDKGVRYEAIFN